ncbi:hypothetical protein IGI04_015122 [Brassica rapa subsp. trilocularis]|uniref:Uncharacterized protein n=1 Tax=Brassica rapa subsp. trilocularis TaxID=1813537 RepID=A0ABQ7MP70_BRACM|nr:hypothetical protein IGI04_015122 [Brassica rapa subsp. trilocularis]
MRASPMKGGETATIKRMVKDVQSTVACSIHERLKHGVIHYTTSKSLRSQLPLSVFLNSVLTAFSLSFERCSVSLGFWTMIAVNAQFPGPLFNAMTIYNVVVRV